MHIAHVASVLIDRNLFFSDVLIESSGGTSPVRCHGHRKADAVEMKRLIEQFQSEYYRGQRSNGRRDVENLLDVETARRSERRPDRARRASSRSSSRRCARRSCASCARGRTSRSTLEALMQTFGRMRLDVENCIRELPAFGARAPRGRRRARRATRSRSPTATPSATCSTQFLERRATVSHEDRSPAVQRFREMIGRDEKMLVVFEWIRTAAKSDISVLILGPTGSGKEVVARMIHELSRRGTNKFQAVNCAALPDTLFESEIFGYEKGAFTGAHDRKPGRLELANNGTLFLDEIGDLSLVAQAKLLRVLEERRFERLGGNTSIEVNFRLISATNRPLDQFVRDSRFREDLYYRVNAFSIRLPSLRERASDIPVLAQRFLARYCAANGLPLDGKSFAKEGDRPADALSLAGQHPRAREHGVPRGAVVARPRHPAGRHRVPARQRDAGRGVARAAARRSPKPSARTSSASSRACNWNKKQAAGVLEISRGTLYRKILEYGLETDPRLRRRGK